MRFVWLCLLCVLGAASAAGSDNASTTVGMDAWTSSLENFRATASQYGAHIRHAVEVAAAMSWDDWAQLASNFPENSRKWWEKNSRDDPLRFFTRLATLAFLIYVWALARAKDVIRATGLSKDQQQDLIDEWEPEPLVPRAPKGTVPKTEDGGAVVVASKGKHVRVRGLAFDVLNCASCDFLGVAASAAAKATSKTALHKYTLGSCGPRGFYGTTDAHLSLETSLAELMGAPQSITYSDHTATVASAIPAFSKRSDIIVVDDGVNHAVQTGCTLSRSRVVTFRHNNMLNLEQVVKSLSRIKKDVRKFIVVEGLYANLGDLCPLPEVLHIARRYRFRVILDDSLGFGVLGKRGRGTAEHFGLEPLDVDVTLGSMATSLGSVGGFCVGDDEVVDHQRLSGAGYVYSASLPPFLCSVAERAIEQLRDGTAKVAKLRSNAATLRAMLEESRKRFKITSSHAESPVIHLRLSWHSDKPANDPARVELGRNLQKVMATQDTDRAARRNTTDDDDDNDDDEGDVAAEDGGEAAGDEHREWPYAPVRPKPAQRRFQSPEDVDLDRVVQEALERGVLLARSRYLVTDQYAPAMGIKVHVTAQMTREDMVKIVGVLEEAVEAAFEHRFAVPSSPMRMPALRKRAV